VSIFRRGRGIAGSRLPTRNIQSKNWHPCCKKNTRQYRVTYIFGSGKDLEGRAGGGLHSLEGEVIAVCWLRWCAATMHSRMQRTRAPRCMTEWKTARWLDLSNRTSSDQADFPQWKGLARHCDEGVTKDGVNFCVVAGVRLEWNIHFVFAIRW
jgi:hypothetical protein